MCSRLQLWSLRRLLLLPMVLGPAVACSCCFRFFVDLCGKIGKLARKKILYIIHCFLHLWISDTSLLNLVRLWCHAVWCVPDTGRGRRRVPAMGSNMVYWLCICIEIVVDTRYQHVRPPWHSGFLSCNFWSCFGIKHQWIGPLSPFGRCNYACALPLGCWLLFVCLDPSTTRKTRTAPETNRCDPMHTGSKVSCSFRSHLVRVLGVSQVCQR